MMLPKMLLCTKNRNSEFHEHATVSKCSDFGSKCIYSGNNCIRLNQIIGLLDELGGLYYNNARSGNW